MASVEIMNTKNAIIADHLSKIFYSKPKLFYKAQVINAVEKISFQINQGEYIAFIGPNGGGKSTTVKMLTSILYPTSGTACVLGLNPWKSRKELCYKIGAVFGQKSQLYYHLPPRFTFHLLAAAYDIPDKEANERLKKLIQTFEIEDFMHRPVRTLSLGERMRCEIVASLIHRPEILFLDEPTIGLDIDAKHMLRHFLKMQTKEEGTTIFLTSHDTGDIESICSRVLLINNGRLMLDSTVDQLKHNYIHHKYINAQYENGSITRIQIDVTKENLKDKINQLLQQDSLLDLSIEDQPLEETISILYQKTGQ